MKQGCQLPKVLSMQSCPRVLLEFFNEMAEETVLQVQRKHPRMGPAKILQKIREKALVILVV